MCNYYKYVNVWLCYHTTSRELYDSDSSYPVSQASVTRLSHSGQKAKWPRGVATELLRWRVPTHVRGQCIFMRQKLEIVFFLTFLSKGTYLDVKAGTILLTY